MFNSMKKHTPERLEELLREYSGATDLGATRRILKRNMYLGENVGLLAYASNALINIDDERAEFYARKALQLFDKGNIPTLWLLPELHNFSESDLEKIMPFLDKILPSREQYGRKGPDTQERKYFDGWLNDPFSRSMVPQRLGGIRQGRAKLEFVVNNEYNGNNKDVLVEFSNIFHATHGLEWGLFRGKIDVSESEWQEDEDKLKQIEILKDKAIAYAERVINANPKDYSLLRKLDCVLSKTKPNHTSIYQRKVMELLDSPEEVLKVLDFVFKYRTTEYGFDDEKIDFYEAQRWTLSMLLIQNPDKLEYLRRAAKLEHDYFQATTFPNSRDYKERAKEFYKKVYDQTQDTSEVPEDLWQDLGFGRWARNGYGYAQESKVNQQRKKDGTFFNWWKNVEESFSNVKNKTYKEPFTSFKPNPFDVAFTVLGVTSTATYEEAHSAYRKQAIKYHPDRNKGDKDAEGRMKEINLAWQDLQNNYYQKLNGEATNLW